MRPSRRSWPPSSPASTSANSRPIRRWDDFSPAIPAFSRTGSSAPRWSPSRKWYCTCLDFRARGRARRASDEALRSLDRRLLADHLDAVDRAQLHVAHFGAVQDLEIDLDARRAGGPQAPVEVVEALHPAPPHLQHDAARRDARQLPGPVLAAAPALA